MDRPESLLERLRSRTAVDCDNLDASVAESLGPFEDCTSNQAIAWMVFPLCEHRQLVEKAVDIAREQEKHLPQIGMEALAIEVGMILFGKQLLPHLKGYFHVQVNPFDAYSTGKMIEDAERLVYICRLVDFDVSRLCVKVPSTWEGLQACRVLEEKGIPTLATTLFTIEQAITAGEAKCHYVAPYVNDIRTQTESNYHDPKPLREICVQAQSFYRKNSLRTKVLLACMTTAEECFSFRGADHITISPPLLEELAKMTNEGRKGETPSLFDELEKNEHSFESKESFINDEEAFRMRLTRSDQGDLESKLIKAINIFCDMQTKLEDFVRPLCNPNQSQ